MVELPAIGSASTTPANPATSTPITAVSTKVLNFDKEIIPKKVTSSSAADSSPSQGESDSEMDEDDILGFDIDSFNVLSKENPAAAMESLASSKGSRSSKTQHSTTASETSEAESAKWAPYVEKLKAIIMEPDFFQSLAVGADVQEILNLTEQVKTNISPTSEPMYSNIIKFEKFVCQTLGDFSQLADWKNSHEKAVESKEKAVDTMKIRQAEIVKTKSSIKALDEQMAKHAERIANLERELAAARATYASLEEGKTTHELKKKTAVKEYNELLASTKSSLLSIQEASEKKEHFDKELKLRASELVELKKKFS